MESKWRETTLGNVIELQRGYDLPSKSRRPGPYPVVSSSGTTDKHADFKVHGPGVVTGRYGTIGQVFYVTGDYWPLNTTLYVKDFKGNDPRFISYFLRTIDFSSYSGKSAVPGINRNHLHRAAVRVPPLAAQRRIASILGRLDDKIELNRRMSETLEKMAAALFKSWFVDFEPVHAGAEGRNTGLPDDIAALFPSAFEDSELGEIPKGWTVKSIDQIATYLNGVASQKYPAAAGAPSLPVIKIKELNCGVTAATGRASTTVPEKFLVDDGDVLFSWSGTLMVDVWGGGRGVLNQHLFKVSSEDYPAWLVYHATNHFLSRFRQIAAGKATTMGHIKRRHLTDAKLALPGGDVVRRRTESVTRLFDLRTDALVQARKLTQLRDTLLPKLVSGELNASQSAEQTEAALV